MKKRFLSLFSVLALAGSFAYGQNVGVGTNTPLEKLHVAGTLRVDDLQTAAPAAATTDKVVWVDANGKAYSFPAGAAGKILGVNGAGVLAWLNPGVANTLNNGQIWIGDATNTPVAQTASGDALIDNAGVITIQDNAVDGTDISISAESNGSLMYFDGTNWVNLGIGSAGQILSISGGVPTWINPATAPTTGDLTTSTSGVTITGGTGAVFGGGTTVNVATNALNQNGLVAAPTAANALQVWGTDALGNPGWVAVSTLLTINDVLAGVGNNAVSITNGTNQVVGATDMTVNVATNALTQDGVVTGTTAANITDVWGTDASGVPAWRDPNALLTKNDIVAGVGNNAVSITNGTGQIVGGVNATVDVATNALNQAGVVTGTTGANANQVWGTDALGNPAWITPANDDWHLIGNTTTNDPAVPAMYGTSTIAVGENYLGTTDAQDLVLGTNAIERLRVKQTTGYVGLGTAAPITTLHVNRGDDVNKAAAYGFATQTTAGADYQNIGVQGAGSGLAGWGYGIGVAGLADNSGGAWRSVGVYARYGTTLPAYNWLGTDLPNAALYTDGGGLAPAALFTNGNVGITGATANPTADSRLDVYGDLALREGTAIALAAGNNNNVAIAGEQSHYRITGPAAAFTITGFTNGNNGQVLNVINATTQTMTLADANAGSTATNQLQTGGSNVNIAAGGAASFIYNSTLTRWILTGTSGAIDGTDWKTLGNAGTNAANNFVGTTDPVDFVTRTSSVERMRVTSGGNVGIGTTTPNHSLVVNPLVDNGGIYLMPANGANSNGGEISAQDNTHFNVSNGRTTNPTVSMPQYGLAFPLANFGSETWLSGYSGIAMFSNGLERMTLSQGGNFGINATTPVSRLDLNGDLALREGTAIAVAAGTNAVTLTGENSHYRLTGAAGAFNINTIAGGNNGQLLTLINATGQTMTLNNNNAANGILTGNGVNMVSNGTGNSSVTMMYNATLARWVVTSASGMLEGNAWNLTGNAGTSAATNFVGTTDNVDFVTRTNNTEMMRINAAGVVGIGTATAGGIGGNIPAGVFPKLDMVAGGTQLDYVSRVYGGDSYHVIQRANGTGAAPTAVSNGNSIGALLFYGYDGTSYGQVSGIRSYVDGATGAGDMPGNLIFYTTADAMNFSLERMRITNVGNVGIGTTAPAHKVDIAGTGGTTIDLRTTGRIWTNSTDGGMWLSDLQDCFMGNISATQFGFWSNGAGWNALNIRKADGYIGVGTSAPTARLHVVADANNIPVIYGVNTNNTGGTTSFGVRGESSSTGLGSAGVSGVSSNGSQNEIGVVGDYTLWGTGVFGLGWAAAYADMPATRDFGVFGTVNFSTGTGVYGRNTSLTAGSAYGMYCNGNFAVVTGTKSGSVPTTKGNQLVYCTESPEIWFEDLGTARLQNGQTHVKLDELFIETVFIDESHPFHVFLQEQGDSKGLYFTPDADGKGFTVTEKQGGNANITFSYRIMAKRRFFQDHRFGVDANQPFENNLVKATYVKPGSTDVNEMKVYVEEVTAAKEAYMKANPNATSEEQQAFTNMIDKGELGPRNAISANAAKRFGEMQASKKGAKTEPKTNKLDNDPRMRPEPARTEKQEVQNEALDIPNIRKVNMESMNKK